MIPGLVTAALIVCFLTGIGWAWSGKRRPEFDAAARLPLEEEQSP